MTMTREQVADALERDEGVESHTGRSTVEPELLKAAISHLRQPAPTAQGEMPPLPEPAYWMTHESQWRMKGGGNSKGAVPVHAKRSATATIPLFTADQVRAAIATAQAAAGVPEGWISVEDRMPPQGETVLVYAPADAFKFGFDTWQMQRESPVSFSSVTVETGVMWDEHEFEEITHWMPLAAPGSAPSATAQSDSAGDAIPAINLIRDAKGMCSVAVEVGGKWVEVIRDSHELIHHTVNPSGIRAAIAASAAKGEQTI